MRGERCSRQALETSNYSRSQTTPPMFWLCPLPSLSDLRQSSAMIGRPVEDQLFHYPWCRGQKGNEPEPVKIDGHAAVGATGFKLETCIIRSGPRDHTITVL